MVVLVKLPSKTMLHWPLRKASTLLSTLRHMSTIRQTLLKRRAYFPIIQVRLHLGALRFSWLILPATRRDHSPVKHFSNMTSNTSLQIIKDPYNTHMHNITSPGTTWRMLLDIHPSQLDMTIHHLDNTSIPAILAIVPIPLNATHPRRGTPTETIRMLPLRLPISPLSFKVLIRTPFSSTKKKSVTTSVALEPMLGIWLLSKDGPRCRLIAALTLLVLEPNLLVESSSVCRWGLEAGKGCQALWTIK
jgi:hypothetical protein